MLLTTNNSESSVGGMTEASECDVSFSVGMLTGMNSNVVGGLRKSNVLKNGSRERQSLPALSVRSGAGHGLIQ